MTNESEWPDWAPRPVTCFYCHQRVTLKQARTTRYDPKTKTGSIRHNDCKPYAITVNVESTGT